MLRRLLLSIGATALAMFGPALSAQDADSSNWFDATILEVNESDRMITVRLDENEAEEAYHVSEDAELVRVRANFEEPIELAALDIGDEVRLEFDNIEGRATLRKITSETPSG